MTLRTKLLLGYGGFVLALGLLGAWSARTLSQMSAVSGRIIAENYDSVVAAQDMKESLEPQFNDVRAASDRLLRLNQEAMRRKADAASRIARRWFFVTLALAVVLMGAGVAIELSLSKAIVGPVAQLTAATTRLASGDLETPAVPVRSGDEIGRLAESFNRMADRLRELRRPDMGRLLVAQQTTEAVIDSLFDPVIVADGQGLVTRVNPAAERLFGAKSDALGKPIDAVTRDVRIAQSVADVLKSHAPAASEDAAATLPWAVDGARRAFRIRSTPMTDADDRLVGVVTLLEDVTHLSEVSRLKSEFIASASHELRTPLTSVQMGIHLLLEGSAESLDERQRDILQVCREDTTRLDRLMRELLDLSKLESGAVTPQVAPMRPARLVSEAVDRLRLQVEAKGVRLEVDAPPDLPQVAVDRGQIERVIGHLITNAMRATPEGGTITVAAVRRGDEVAMSVADTGSGIPREFLSTIFEPFVQVPHPSGGGGLGLTMSRRIVEGHGGRLSVQSEPGHGSTFTFTVPIAAERQAS